MPILAAEPSVFPENLLHVAVAEPTQRRWWALYTKARQEKAVARQLLRYEVPFYLPLVRKEKLVRGRRLRSYVPLFGGYVFLFGTEEERVWSLATNRVSRILSVDDQDLLWHDLSQLHRMIEADAPLAVEQRLSAGQRVRITAGSMKGLEGTVLARRGQTRLLVTVSFLQQGVSVELDDFLLESID